MSHQIKHGLFIGLMSGTSLDGLDAVLLELSERKLHTVSSHSIPFSNKLRATLLQLCSPGENEIDLSGQAGIEYALEATACIRALLNKASVSATDIRAIGSHGQTVRHRPDLNHPFTLQIGDSSTLAHHTGITVISDFRMADMAAGGQGAPLVPAFHQKVFSDESADRVILNIGGIANITLVPSKAKASQEKTYGFDTGPGNTLLDQWIDKHLSKPFDDQGNWARGGTVNASLLNHLLSAHYFSLDAPKSTGRELFNLQWFNEQLESWKDSNQETTAPLEPQDIQRTLLELSAVTISNDIKKHTAQTQNVGVYACGGGIKNELLISRIQALLGQEVSSTQQLGLDPQLVEASAFAWLAQQTLNGLPGNLPSATGAQTAKVLGGIYPA